MSLKCEKYYVHMFIKYILGFLSGVGSAQRSIGGKHKAHTNVPKFTINIHPTPSEAESQVYVTKETIVIPAPGTIKVEPNTTEESDEPAAKRMKYHQQQEHVLQLGADAILADPPSDQPHSSAPENIGIRYKKE